MTTTTVCPHATNAPTSLEVVRLWDGRDHCRNCVEAACPGLWEFAQGRDWLVDSIPYDPNGGLLEFLKFAGLIYGVLALVGVGLLAGLDVHSTLIVVGAIALALAVAIIPVLDAVFKARHVLPTVLIRDGMVEVFRPYHQGGRQPVATFRLSEARWHMGRVREDSSCLGRLGRGGALMPNNPAIVLRSPRAWKDVAPPSEVTATGSSPELVRFWRGFLKLAGVPEGK